MQGCDTEPISATEQAVGDLLRAGGATLAVAESCTGGLLGGRITRIAGCSDYFLGGVIAYANAVKIRELGIPKSLLQQHGAVSAAVAQAMAAGVRRRFDADYGLAVTGIAGPDGGTLDKPVGTVWLACATGSEPVRTLCLQCGPGDRRHIRECAVQGALDLLHRALTRGACKTLASARKQASGRQGSG